MSIEREIKRRADLWNLVCQHDISNLDPSFLKELKIYSGQQGVWVNTEITKNISPNNYGITVGV